MKKLNWEELFRDFQVPSNWILSISDIEIGLVEFEAKVQRISNQNKTIFIERNRIEYFEIDGELDRFGDRYLFIFWDNRFMRDGFYKF